MATKNTKSGRTISKTKSKAKKEDDGILICNTAHLAAMFGVSERQIYNQIQNEVVIKVGANKFDCVQSVANYIGLMREQEEVRKQSPEKIRAETEAVKLQHEQFKARKTELQVLQMEGKLHYEEDVKSLWNSSVIAVKSRLTAIGVKVAPQLKGETDEAIIKELIDREVRDALKEISNYDASAYEKDLNAEANEEEADDE